MTSQAKSAFAVLVALISANISALARDRLTTFHPPESLDQISFLRSYVRARCDENQCGPANPDEFPKLGAIVRFTRTSSGSDSYDIICDSAEQSHESDVFRGGDKNGVMTLQANDEVLSSYFEHEPAKNRIIALLHELGDSFVWRSERTRWDSIQSEMQIRRSIESIPVDCRKQALRFDASLTIISSRWFGQISIEFKIKPKLTLDTGGPLLLDLEKVLRKDFDTYIQQAEDKTKAVSISSKDKSPRLFGIRAVSAQPLMKSHEEWFH